MAVVNTGYILLDGSGIDIATQSASIPGIYNATLAAMDTSKVIYLTNITNNGSRYSPMPVYGIINGESIVLTVTGKTLTITTSDAVTIS